MYNALDVAQFIVTYEYSQGRCLNNLRLQNLLYYIQALFIAVTPDKSPCFTNKMEAWDCGPVILDVYKKYRTCGSAIIPPKKVTTYTFLPEHIEMMKAIIIACHDLPTTEMSKYIHQQDSWADAYFRSPNKEITIDAMRSYFGDI